MKKSKGLSLLELLVAVAMCSVVIVTLSSIIVSASRTYSRETTKSTVMNNTEDVFNRIENSLMEAQAINRLAGSSFYIENDVYNDDHDNFAHKIGKTIYYDSSAKKLYMTSDISSIFMGSSNKEYYLLANNVESFDVKINPDCIQTDGEGNKYLTNPVMLDVSLRIEIRKRAASYSRKVVLRNKLEEIYFEGVDYEVK